MSGLLPTGDVLAAGALALGALTVMYGLWMPKIVSAVGQDKAHHREDRDPAIKVLRDTRRRTALPLAMANSILLAVLSPSVLAVVVESVGHAREAGMKSVGDYRPALAVFIVVWVFLGALTALTWAEICRLSERISEFDAPDQA